MHVRLILALGLLMSLWSAVPTSGGTGDISPLIESFMARQFPESRSHFWVVNGTQWQTESELVVDLNAVVMGHTSPSPTEQRFLLLIVKGELAAAQNIPLDAKSACQPEAA